MMRTHINDKQLTVEEWTWDECQTFHSYFECFEHFNESERLHAFTRFVLS